MCAKSAASFSYTSTTVNLSGSSSCATRVCISMPVSTSSTALSTSAYHLRKPSTFPALAFMCATTMKGDEATSLGGAVAGTDSMEGDEATSLGGAVAGPDSVVVVVVVPATDAEVIVVVLVGMTVRSPALAGTDSVVVADVVPATDDEVIVVVVV